MTIQKKNVIILKKRGYGGMVDATDLKYILLIFNKCQKLAKILSFFKDI
jgi:hypothetical protein